MNCDSLGPVCEHDVRRSDIASGTDISIFLLRRHHNFKEEEEEEEVIKLWEGSKGPVDILLDKRAKRGGITCKNR